MLKKENAIRIDCVCYGKQLENGKHRYQKVYIFNCTECAVEVRSQSQYLSKHSGKCVKCAQFSDPFRAAFNELIRGCKRRGYSISLVYEDFFALTSIKSCHYCATKIDWYPHTKHNGKEVKGSRSYKLDRKNNDCGYTKENCVVCCWKCNQSKGNRYSYEEWYEMTAYFRKKY
jgi:hypothetical protein